MAKRKRDDVSDIEIIVDKKSKKDHRKAGKRRASEASARDVPPSAKAKAVVAAPASPTLTTTTSQTGTGALVPPLGLSKGARKRWRKRQKQLADRASLRSFSTADLNDRRNLAAEPRKVQAAKQVPRPPFKKSSLRVFGVTHLMPRAQKEWHEEAPIKPPRSRKKAGKGTTEVVSHHVDSSDKTDSSDEDIVVVASNARRRGPNAASESSTSSSSLPHQGPTGTKTSAGAQAPKFLLSTTLLAVPTKPAARRMSHGSRATSIPSFSTNADPLKSFKAFSAFNHRNVDSSDDEESERSESEESATNTGHVKAVKTEEPTVRAAAATRATFDDDPDHTTRLVSAELARRFSSDEFDVDQLPRFSDSVSHPTSANGSSWPANVGIKRNGSFLDQGPGGTPSGSGVAPNCEQTTTSSFNGFDQSDPLEANDDSQELWRTVEELSNYVNETTRPLPASKKPRSPDPGQVDQENGVLTSAPSDRRLTRSMVSPKATRNREGQLDDPLNTIAGGSAETQNVPRTIIEPSRDLVEELLSELSSASVGSNINVANPNDCNAVQSSSSLSELSRSPSPPPASLLPISKLVEKPEPALVAHHVDTEFEEEIVKRPKKPRKKLRMTGHTSKHFTPKKVAARRSSAEQTDAELAASQDEQQDEVKAQSPAITDTISPLGALKRALKEMSENAESTPDIEQKLPDAPPPALSTRSSTKKRKSTGKKSTYFTPTKPPLDPNIIDRVDFYNTTASGRKGRVPAGTSTAPVPPISAERFGIIQEKLWREPFWLLIAVTFLNKTTGRAAVPVFWALKEKYPTAELLANAEVEELCDMIHHLGLQNQRAKRLISMAQAWVEREPAKGVRDRTLHYPSKDDGREFKRGEIVEDGDDCAGALEIGHMPGCGPYAWDSWRIFCRDILRGVAEDYNGAGTSEDFIPEWKKVLPGDKELRACLRWMWLREGWIWDHETGEKRQATEEEMEKAILGEMEINDPQERKFAAQAAGIEVSPTKPEETQDGTSLLKQVQADETSSAAKQEARPKTSVNQDSDSDNIVVTPMVTPAKRRTRHSSRLST